MIREDKKIGGFLEYYSEDISGCTLVLREIILKTLPEIREQIDDHAKMIAYAYGRKYIEMICTLIPSKKGIKLAFYKGPDLPDPENLLEGNGKISRYVAISKKDDIKINALTNLLKEAHKAFKLRIIK